MVANYFDFQKKNTGGSEDRQKDASSTAKEQKYFCHVCNIGCRDEDDFRRHMNSAKHKKRMVDVLSVHQEKSSQLMARLKAEEHLRKIEVKDKSGQVVMGQTTTQEEKSIY